MIQMKLFRQAFEYPAKAEPKWASTVERWYQLDAAAFGLVEVFSQLKSELERPPTFLILASPGSSSETDFQFVQSGAASPSKFVHTLPSVRAAPLLQVMKWQGPVLCVQNDPVTWLSGIADGLSYLTDSNALVWVLTVHSKACGSANNAVSLAELSNDTVKKKFSTPNMETFLIETTIPEENSPTTQLTNDTDFWNWLENERKLSFDSKAHGFRICRHT
jgi:hypothetical protein